MPCLINGSRKIPDNHSILSVRVLSFLVGSLCCFLLFFYASSIRKMTFPSRPNNQPPGVFVAWWGEVQCFSSWNEGDSVLLTMKKGFGTLPIRKLSSICCFIFGFFLCLSTSVGRKDYGSSLKFPKISIKNPSNIL